MNRKLYLTIFSSALVLLLSACGQSTTEEVDSELREDGDTEQIESDNVDAGVSEDESDEDITTDVDELNKIIADDDVVKIELINVERTRDNILDTEDIRVNFEIENKTDSKIIVQSRDVSADGYMVDDIASLSSEIAPGKKAKDRLSLDEMFLDEGEELPDLDENLEMILIVINDETYDELTTYNVNIDF